MKKTNITFKEYYQHYLTLHQNKVNRWLHAIGQFATITFVVFCIWSGFYPLLILTPFIVYPFAWTGHLYFEKNKPAAFYNPILAKASDWVMLKDLLLGKLK